MNEPIAYFLTWVTYGTWLPGDSRGWVEYREGWQLPDPIRELESAAKMTEDACLLTPQQQKHVEKQIEETCLYRGWHLHSVNCRSNHIHTVVSAHDTNPKKIRSDLKAWTARRLKENSSLNRDQWWAERGSIRFLYNDESLEAANYYVMEGQDRQRDSKYDR